ncbi:MAG TPA: flavin reductase family protein, partial [Chitinophagaceae bacterium]|nr:flavin reductase family protein [Chitinophagaceae bacterium]
LPEALLKSKVLTGNDLGILANVETIPTANPGFDDNHLKQIVQYYSVNPAEMEKELHLYAKKLLEKGDIAAAWQVLLTTI